MRYATETSAIQFLFSFTFRWITFLNIFFRTPEKKTLDYKAQSKTSLVGEKYGQHKTAQSKTSLVGEKYGQHKTIQSKTSLVGEKYILPV